MSGLFSWLFWGLALVGGLGAWAFAWRRFYQLDRGRDSVHLATTGDGWRIALSRYRAGAVEGSQPFPVLLCPGLGLSGAVFEIGEPCFAETLAQQGFDCWIVDPRGRGGSSRPRLWGSFRRRWTLDDYIQFDLPAAVAALRRETGAEQVHLVGFGVASLCAHARLDGADGSGGVASVVSVAGGAVYSRQRIKVPGWWLTVLGRLPVRALAWTLAPLLGRWTPWPLAALQEVDNVEGRSYRAALTNCLHELSCEELAQLARWIERDRLHSEAEPELDYREALGLIGVPVLLIAGPRDPLSSPAMVYATRDLLRGCPSSRVVVAGRHEGLSANYGHWDLLVGRNASREIAALIGAWMREPVGDDATGAPGGGESSAAEGSLGEQP